jgi:carbamoyltransferase
MTICGIKLTHDGAIALVDNGKLIFSYEMEKLDNTPRHADFNLTMERIGEILLQYGYTPNNIDSWVIDGWDNWRPDNMNAANSTKEVAGPNIVKGFELAKYGHVIKEEDILQPVTFKNIHVPWPYNSYMHVSSHVIGAYCTSPFAHKCEDAFVLVWDGGMPPQLFYYDCQENKVRNLGYLFLLTGYMYINFAHAFEPFNKLEKELSLAGKMMAYIALGSVDVRIVEFYKKTFNDLNRMVDEENVDIDVVAILTAEFIKQSRLYCDQHQIEHRHMLTSFHEFLEQIIIEKLQEKVTAHALLTRNLCFAGGSALNIKWNSAIRETHLFKDVWVPPFPNDAGSAIGTACCEMLVTNKVVALNWNVYSGPPVGETNDFQSPYSVTECSLEELARILHTFNEPVVFVNGAAELGPRSLGNRSILAAAVEPAMKKLLNKVKGREDYRPVAPVCIEEEAPVIFSPGTPDPFMLYEHIVKQEWKDKVPAICHIDGTARLQTVNRSENEAIYDLLVHYKNLSGIPLLCNTSANYKGKGFFPDVKSVMDWGEVNFIWNNGKLYHKASIVELQPLLKVNEF